MLIQTKNEYYYLSKTFIKKIFSLSFDSCENWGNKFRINIKFLEKCNSDGECYSEIETMSICFKLKEDALKALELIQKEL